MSDTKSIKSAGCDEYDASLLTVETAQQRILQVAQPISGVERVAIRSALGRVLAEPIISPINVPPYANSAMDGYAINTAELQTGTPLQLSVIGTSWAGEPFAGAIKPGQCVRIMTGAKMPAGADSVVMQEHVHRDSDTISISTLPAPGRNVRHPGEDIAKGSTVLEPGKRLGPAELGLLASLGFPEVSVRRRVRVAFFSTGDELRAVGEPLAEGQIYDSNRYTLYGMLAQAGVELLDMGVIRDEQAAVEQAFVCLLYTSPSPRD